MATCFGWTWEYIDEFVTVPRLTEITHVLAAAYLGVGKKKGSTDMAAFVSEAVGLGADPTPLMPHG